MPLHLTPGLAPIGRMVTRLFHGHGSLPAARLSELALGIEMFSIPLDLHQKNLLGLQRPS
jgi:hypothetical protein